MYLQVRDNYWVIDIEGDPIPSTRVWCLCAMNVSTGETWESSDPQEIARWISDRLAENGKLIGHNIIGYDAPTLNRLLGTRITISSIIDTMLLSMLYSPSLEGGHSLGAWGERLSFPKGEFTDFSQFSQEMLLYCRKDVALTRRVFIELIRRMNRAKFTDLGIEIEHRSWQLIQTQRKNGFAFNYKEAHILYGKLRAIEKDLQDRVHALWPPTLKLLGEYSRPYKKDGSPSANFVRHCSEYERVDISEDKSRYRCYGYVSFNIGSPDQRTEKLLELGWRPHETERTKTGKPKPTDKGHLVQSLQQFVDTSGLEGPSLIAQWMDINSRANAINTWLEAYNETTGCIHGSLWLANTLRYRHSNPNTANIPAVRVAKDKDGVEHIQYGLDGVFTYEARDLWVTRDPVRRRLVGTDAKGIQLRVLAHYLNNPSFTKAVLDGDPHSYNQEIGGFKTRAIAKTFIYAFLLGSGDAKTGQIIGGSPKEGKAIKERFIGNFPGLRELLERLERDVERTGRIVLCDGTPVIVTQPHTRLGYLLQGDESRIMKMAAILSHKEVVRRKLDVLKVGDIHDEWQNDILLEHVDTYIKEVAPTAFRMAGERFNYRVPIECDSKIGLTWAETH